MNSLLSKLVYLMSTYKHFKEQDIKSTLTIATDVNGRTNTVNIVSMEKLDNTKLKVFLDAVAHIVVEVKDISLVKENTKVTYTLTVTKYEAIEPTADSIITFSFDDSDLTKLIPKLQETVEESKPSDNNSSTSYNEGSHG